MRFWNIKVKLDGQDHTKPIIISLGGFKKEEKRRRIWLNHKEVKCKKQEASMWALKVRKSQMEITKSANISTGNSMICGDIWHKYHEWYFEIVIRNFTRLTAREIWDNFEISQVVFVPNITYKSCYYFFILLQGAKKIIFTACHSGKLKLAFTSPNIISTSPQNFLLYCYSNSS